MMSDKFYNDRLGLPAASLMVMWPKIW